MSVKNLEQFGEFMKLLQAHCVDRNICFWAFLSFITTCHPTILKAATPEALAAQVESLLAGVETPKIELEPGIDELVERKKVEKRNRKRSWKFWR
jgi:hypothetical protein